MFRKLITCIVLGCTLSIPLSASASSVNAFVEGCRSFSDGDWDSAEFSLKKAIAYLENQNPDTYYMLITAEVNAGNEKSALDDCSYFLENFHGSIYYPRIQFQYGRLLYELGEYEKSIIALSDFCHQNENNEMYSHALFYVGESLLAGYKYNEAGKIFERIVSEFPESSKAVASKYRIDTILQHAREEKLLYLLKQTGEEYLSAKEEYEKQLRLMNMDSSTRIKLSETQQRNEELETQLRDLETKLTTTIVTLEDKSSENVPPKREDFIEPVKDNGNLPVETAAYVDNQENSEPVVKDVDVPSMIPFDEKREQIRILKRKAKDAQQLLGNNGY